MEKETKKQDRFGEICLILAIISYIGAIIFFVSPLPNKIDTFLVVSWVFLPAVVGSIIYMKIQRSGNWD